LWRAFFGFQRSSRHEFRATKNLPFSLRNPSKKYVNKAKKKQQIRIPAQEQSAADAAKQERERERGRGHRESGEVSAATAKT